jgi:hypothetical protein
MNTHWAMQPRNQHAEDHDKPSGGLIGKWLARLCAARRYRLWWTIRGGHAAIE